MEPSLNIYTNVYENTNSFININFGDICYNFLNDISLYHPRLNNTDISFELSYNLPNYLTNINNLYDVSALIYHYNDGESVSIINDISFFNISKNNSPNSILQEISSSILKPDIIITISPPQFYPENLNILTISHEAGEFISDLSLIEGISVYSVFDDFFYNSQKYTGEIDISYSETNFDVCINNLNQLKPQHNDYIITYNTKDKNNISSSITRLLSVKDTQGPILTLKGLSNEIFDQINNEYYQEEGIEINDIGSYIKKLEIYIRKEINGILVDEYNDVILNFQSMDYYLYEKAFYNNFIDKSHGNYNYIITYTAEDIYNNSTTITRNLKIKESNELILLPSIIINENKFYFDSDFSFNNTDISLNFIFLSKTLTYEATEINVFNNITFHLQAIFNDSSNNINIINPVNNIISNKVGNYNIFSSI